MQVALFLLCFGFAAGHILMKWPLARGYTGNTTYLPVDYNLKSPLQKLAFCNGKPAGAVPTLTVKAGGVIPVQFEGSARHGGGVCQFSLSYDNDASFTLIEQFSGSCPDAQYSWPVRIPPTAPACKHCTFAWSWVNAIGNREFYMNCADIEILAGPQSQPRLIGGSPINISNLPGHPTVQPPAAEGPPTTNKVIQFK